MSERGAAAGPRPWFSAAAISIAFALELSSAVAFDSLPCFPTSLRLLPGESITSVAVGNFNFGNAPDIAAIASGSVVILLGDGNGGFGSPTRYEAGASPAVIALADFNRDTRPDLAVAGPGTVSVLLGDGFGAFGPATAFPAGGNARALAIGDFNSDGNPDVAIGFSTSIQIRFGDGTGGFNLSSFGFVSFPPPAQSIFSVAVGDFNRDGRQDLVTQTDFSGHVWIVLGNGGGGFGTPTSFPGGVLPWAVAVADFNRDANLDVAIANGTTTIASVVLGNGAGQLAAPIGLGSGPRSRAIAVADFDRNGHADLVVGNEGFHRIELFSGNGAGGFAGPFSYPVGNSPTQVAVGDFNRDERADVVTANLDGLVVSLNGGLTLFPEFPNLQGRLGVPHETEFGVTGGSAPYTIAQTGEVPPGMSFSVSDRNISFSGTPTQAGEFFFIVSASSANGCSVTGTYRFLVGTAITNLTLASSANPSVSGQAIVLTATVVPFPPEAGTPTGTVTFFAAGAPLGTAPVIGGIATLTVSSLPPGSTPITANYSGDSNFDPTTAAGFVQGVVAADVPTLDATSLAILAILLAVVSVSLLRRG